MHERLQGLEQVDKVVNITQAPIGRTPRSNPATYVQVMSHIRELFALTPEAKARGYKPGRFSFNVKGGRCEACKGHGQKKDVWEQAKRERRGHLTLETLTALRAFGRIEESYDR